MNTPKPIPFPAKARLLFATPTPEQTTRALDIKRTLGIPRAAGYLRNRGVALCYAVEVLARS